MELSKNFFFLTLLLLQIVACSTTRSNDLVYYKVKVKKGDSLAAIAQRFGLTWQELAAQNGLRDSRDIRIGMQLTVTPSPGGYLANEEQSDEARDSDSDNQNSGGLLFNGSSSSQSFSWPVNGSISSGYGMRGRRMHHGIDIRGQTGTSVRAAAAGKVIFAGRKGGYGRTIIVQHGNLQTLYAHLYKIDVDEGDAVMQNQYIGQVGTSGNAHGAHLHFEVRKENGTINPLAKLKSRAGGAFVASGR